MNLKAFSSDVKHGGRTFALVHERLPWAEVLNAFGEFDLSVADELHEAIALHLRSRLPLVVDLGFCEYLDSTILRVLVRSAKSAPSRLGFVVPASARIRRLFEMTRLVDALSVAHVRDDLRSQLQVA
jgi:anti-anti-sigma factor